MSGFLLLDTEIDVIPSTCINGFEIIKINIKMIKLIQNVLLN